MKDASSESSAGRIEADFGEVESKDMREAVGPTCPSWTNEKHMLYIVSLEESFMNQLYGSPFHLHFKNLTGQNNKRHSNLSLTTTQNNTETNQFKILKQGCWKNMKFENPKSRAQNQENKNKSITSAISGNQWIRHFKSRGKTGISNPGFEADTFKREEKSDLNESTSHEKVSYEEVSDQNFIERETKEISSSHKRKHPLNDQIVPSGKVLIAEESAKT